MREGAAQGLWDAHYPPGHRKPRYFLDEVLHGLGHAGNLASAAGCTDVSKGKVTGVEAASC